MYVGASSRPPGPGSRLWAGHARARFGGRRPFPLRSPDKSVYGAARSGSEAAPARRGERSPKQAGRCDLGRTSLHMGEPNAAGRQGAPGHARRRRPGREGRTTPGGAGPGAPGHAGSAGAGRASREAGPGRVRSSVSALKGAGSCLKGRRTGPGGPAAPRGSYFAP